MTTARFDPMNDILLDNPVQCNNHSSYSLLSPSPTHPFRVKLPEVTRRRRGHFQNYGELSRTVTIYSQPFSGLLAQPPIHSTNLDYFKPEVEWDLLCLEIIANLCTAFRKKFPPPVFISRPGLPRITDVLIWRFTILFKKAKGVEL